MLTTSIPSHTFPKTLTETDVSHTRSLLRLQLHTHCHHRPALPEGHPSSRFQTEVSGPFLLPAAPAARRALLRALRFRAEASSALEGALEGVQAPPGLEGAPQRRARPLLPGLLASASEICLRSLRQWPVVTPVFRINPDKEFF